MSAVDENSCVAMLCCASCGISEGDDIKLMKCTACKSVRYCSVKCQKNDWSQHKIFCKKRAAELRDKILFHQPGNIHCWDCPICMLPLPLGNEECTMYSCCGKKICNGCDYANDVRQFEESLEPKCPFCRAPLPKTEAEIERNNMKRIEANDPVAIREAGNYWFHRGDHATAFTYWTKAAELGDVEAHYELSIAYAEGGFFEKDEAKHIYHLEEAAIGGHPKARCNLGVREVKKDNYDRAMRHFFIAANLGDDIAMGNVMKGYEEGLVLKDEFYATLRAHQAAVDATKSPQREAAAAARHQEHWRSTHVEDGRV